MKRWMRPALAILLGVLALGYIGIVPAQAAKSATQSITYRGYTVSWSKPDASDLRVVRTPGRADHFPARADAASILQAKLRVTNVAVQQASESQTDYCNFVPDSFGAAKFGPACLAHDICYSYGSPTDRLTCDVRLLAGLQQACNVYPEGSYPRLTCYTVASIYFIGVRLFGAAFYHGNGSAL